MNMVRDDNDINILSPLAETIGPDLGIVREEQHHKRERSVENDTVRFGTYHFGMRTTRAPGSDINVCRAAIHQWCWGIILAPPNSAASKSSSQFLRRIKC